MRFGELIFLFIFIAVGLINVIARIIVRQVRIKRAAMGEGKKDQKEPSAVGKTQDLLKPKIEKDKLLEVDRIIEKEQKKWHVREVKMKEVGFSEKVPVQENKEKTEAPPVTEKTAPTVPPTSISVDTTYIPQEKPIRQDFSEDITTIKEAKHSSLESARLPTLKAKDFSRISERGPIISRPAVIQEKLHISLWQKINKLPYLKRAILLSEILGKPKGMQ